MERRETLRKWRRDLGNFLEVTVCFCHLSLAADNGTGLWTECQNRHCRYSKLMEQFSYLTLPARDLLAQQEEKAKALCSGEAAKGARWQADVAAPLEWWQLAADANLCSSATPEQGWLFRGAEVLWSGRLEGGSRWWDTSTSLKCSAPRCGDSDQIKIGDFFFKFLSSLLPSFLPTYFPSFLYSFLSAFFSFSLYIFIKYIH